MKVVPLLFFLLATSIQGGFAALDYDNPLTNPDLPPKVRAHLESRILQWLCPRIKMTASNYIRSRLYPLSGRLTGRLSGIYSFPAPRTRGLSDITYMGPPLYLQPFFMNNNMRLKLQLWLERLTPAQKQKLDNALMESVAAYLKTHPNDFMVSCYIDNTVQNLGDGEMIDPFVNVFIINADVNDTASIQLSPNNSSSAFIAASSSPSGTWSFNNQFVYKCLVKDLFACLSATFFWDISSVTYSHGGKQIVLTQKKPVFWSN
jgi:hypothetical protein